MATPERLAPSRRLQSAATAERDRLGRELGRLDAKAQELRAGLDQIEATRAEWILNSGANRSPCR